MTYRKTVNQSPLNFNRFSENVQSHRATRSHTLSTFTFKCLISQTDVTFRPGLWWLQRLLLLDSLTPNLTPQVNSHPLPELVRRCERILEEFSPKTREWKNNISVWASITGLYQGIMNTPHDCRLNWTLLFVFVKMTNMMHVFAKPITNHQQGCCPLFFNRIFLLLVCWTTI